MKGVESQERRPVEVESPIWCSVERSKTAENSFCGERETETETQREPPTHSSIHGGAGEGCLGRARVKPEAATELRKVGTGCKHDSFSIPRCFFKAC